MRIYFTGLISVAVLLGGCATNSIFSGEPTLSSMSATQRYVVGEGCGKVTGIKRIGGPQSGDSASGSEEIPNTQPLDTNLRYQLTVEMDDGRLLSVEQDDLNGIEQGARVQITRGHAFRI